MGKYKTSKRYRKFHLEQNREKNADAQRKCRLSRKEDYDLKKNSADRSRKSKFENDLGPGAKRRRNGNGNFD